MASASGCADGIDWGHESEQVWDLARPSPQPQGGDGGHCARKQPREALRECSHWAHHLTGFKVGKLKFEAVNEEPRILASCSFFRLLGALDPSGSVAPFWSLDLPGPAAAAEAHAGGRFQVCT